MNQSWIDELSKLRAAAARRAWSSRWVAPCLLLASFVSISPPARAQISVGGSPFVEAWVDACNGNNTNGAVGNRDRPFATIEVAVFAVKNHTSPAPSANNPGLVHVNPGVYDQESLPITIPRYVSIQGTGAKQCIIRVNPAGGPPPGTMQVWWPTPAAGSCNCDPNALLVPKVVLVDLVTQAFETDVPVLDAFEEMIDGFTFQGGDVQVLAHSEGFVLARVSNCIFDMLDDSDVGVPGPTFGILMGSTWDFNPPLIVGYHACSMNILNNTFIQGWAQQVGPGDIPTVIHTARADSVAICDVVDPLCRLTQDVDPNPALRGESEANIQNNLFRSLVGHGRTALMGVDNNDTRVSLGTPTGRTNAFEVGLVGGSDVSGTFCSGFDLTIGKPLPKVVPNPTWPTGADPAFVGEMLTNLLALPGSVGRDWRILPDSILVDKGSVPAAGTIGSPPVSAMILRAHSGMQYVEPFTTPINFMPMSSFDFDAEGYGNMRIEGSSIDIGCDETQVLINAAFGNDSIVHGTSGCSGHCSTNLANGLLNSELIFPGPGLYQIELTRSASPFPQPFISFPPPAISGWYWAYSTLFGTIVPPNPATPVPGATYWMQTASSSLVRYSVPSPLTVTAVTNYFAPFDGVNAHSFGRVAFSGTSGGCSYLNQQGQFTPTVGTAVITNLQSSYEAP